MRAATDGVGVCALGSIKSNIGHTLSAAGVAGIVKAVFALEHKAIPACANFETPNPDLDLATSPFYVNTELRAWDRPAQGIRRAGVSSFGVGGTNAHVVLEEPPPAHSAASSRTWHILPFSTRAQTTLPVLAERMRVQLANLSPDAFADAAYTAQIGRRAFEYRQVVVAEDAASAAAALGSGDAARVMIAKAPSTPAKTAFMFTGQGSQYPGMGADLYRDEPQFRAAVDRCLALLDASTAAELRRLAFAPVNGPLAATSAEDRAALQRTETAQLALFIMHVALADLLAAWGVRPAMMIGHSIGDYAAAYVSGALSLAAALELVTVRGRLMGQMPPGTMLSVAADPAELPPMPPEVSIAAANAPRLIVLAGPTEAIAAYEAALAATGLSSRRLQTSHAFHSAMMEPTLPEFRAAIAQAGFSSPQVPFVSSLTGEFAGAAEVADPDFWARQLREPVQFARGCETLAAAGATVVVEIGPGRGLSAFARQCRLATHGIEIITTMPEPVDPSFHLAAAVGRLWLAGVDIDWAALHAGDDRRRITLPPTPFNRQRFWIEPSMSSAPRETAEKRPNVHDWFYAPAWKQLAPVAAVTVRPAQTPERVLIVGDGQGGLAHHVAQLLTANGQLVTALADTSPAALDELVAGWTDASDTPDRIIHLSSLKSDPRPEADGFNEAAFWQRQDRDVLGLLRLLQTVSTIGANKQLAVQIVSTGLFDLTGSDALVAANAPLITFARVAAQEVAGVTCRLLDIEPISPADDLAELAARIEARFAVSGETDTVVALRRRRAWRLEFAQLDAAALRAPVSAARARGVYLITGGLGKVGLVFARYLADTFGARLVLVGRSALPEPATWDALLADSTTDPDVAERLAAIRDLERRGAEVLAVSADVSSEAEMARVIAAADERFGGIDGIVHCAGVTNVGRIVLDTGLVEFQQNFRSKVFGLRVLMRLLENRSLDFGLVVSSLSAVLGGLGHMAYAAANACADTMVLAHNQTGRGARWTAVDWDSWKFEQGRVDKVQAMLNTLDFSLDENEGTAAIDALLAMENPEHVIVSTGSLGARVRLWIDQHAVLRSDEGHGSGQHQRPDISTPFEEPQGPIEIRLAAIWQDALGLDRVGRNDDFFEVGGHSLLAVQILAKTRDAFGIDFPLERAMEAARLSSAAAVIAELLAADEPVNGTAVATAATDIRPADALVASDANVEGAAEAELDAA
jgi:acyl transferase domain-containing protein/acyl carrier protein